MDWSFLAILACPLMMLFCMKGMFNGHKEKNAEAGQTDRLQHELQQVQIKMADLMEQNHRQTKEIEDLKNRNRPSNVMEMTEEKISGIS